MKITFRTANRLLYFLPQFFMNIQIQSSAKQLFGRSPSLLAHSSDFHYSPSLVLDNGIFLNHSPALLIRHTKPRPILRMRTLGVREGWGEGGSFSNGSDARSDLEVAEEGESDGARRALPVVAAASACWRSSV